MCFFDDENEGEVDFGLGLPDSFDLSENEPGEEPGFGESPLVYPRDCKRCGCEFHITEREQKNMPPDSEWNLCDTCFGDLLERKFTENEMTELGL